MRPRPVPLNLFSIPFGLLGLADCWLVAANFGLVPVVTGRLLVAVAVSVWLLVLVAYLRGTRALAAGIVTELSHPIAGPFGSLAVITPMLAAADALYPLNHMAGIAVVDSLAVATVVLAGWLTGQWIWMPVRAADVHPGYFLPSVAGGFVAAASTALVGQRGAAELLFGLGAVSWLALGSIILGRLFVGPPLPAALTPTLAIEVAPAAVATFAVFVINGQHVDVVVRVLAGYGLLMVLAQIRLLPSYRRLRFMPSTWAFTFSWASVTFAALFWLGVTHPRGWQLVSYLTLGVITAFIGAIAIRTVVALHRGQLLPAVVEPAPTTETSVRAASNAGR